MMVDSAMDDGAVWIDDVAGMDDAFHQLTCKLVAVVAKDHIARGVPACQMAVGYEGRVVWSASLGAADARTRFDLFCASKPLVSSAIWRLAGDQLIDLDAPVATYIPEFGANGKQSITVRQVLLWTPGFPDVPVNIFEAQNRERLRELFASWVPVCAPDERVIPYTICLAWVIAELISVTSGQSYADYFDSQICQPLGLSRCLAIPIEEQQNIATMKAITFDQAGEPRLSKSVMDTGPEFRALGSPATGCCTTAADFALFYQAFLHNPGQLWDPKILAQGTTLQGTWDDNRRPHPRSLGMSLAGPHSMRRYDLGFALGNSPGAFGGVGAHINIGWADPATGISFTFVNNGEFPAEFECRDGRHLAANSAARRGIALTRLASQLRLGG
jgi:CubicO group peptidase (beta-lactamase class C family)